MNDRQVVTFVGVISKATYSEAMPSSFKETPFDVTAEPANSPVAVGGWVFLGSLDNLVLLKLHPVFLLAQLRRLGIALDKDDHPTILSTSFPSVF